MDVNIINCSVIVYSERFFNCSNSIILLTLQTLFWTTYFKPEKCLWRSLVSLSSTCVLTLKRLGGQFDPLPCGFSKNVSFKERVKSWFFVTFNVITSFLKISFNFLIKPSLIRVKVLMSTTLLNLESFADALQEFSKSSQKYWRKNVC